MHYNWQHSQWPYFEYQLSHIESILYCFSEETGYVTGMLTSLPDDIKLEALIELMVVEAIKTSAIESEYLSRQDVFSSIRNQMGLNHVPEKVKDKMARGVSELLVDVRKTYNEPLRIEKLFSWHKMLFTESKRKVNVGSWRKGKEAMRVISGAIGKENIHFEAPPSSKVSREMKLFIEWFNETAPGQKREIRQAPVRAAIAHLYFESIHPFEDGNGRIGRAIAEKALSQSLGRPVMLSLSATIETNKKAYYNALEQAQRQIDINDWLQYFTALALSAQIQAKEFINFLLKKARFFDRYKDALNERQLKVIRKMFEVGPEGFEGGMSAKKYISITGSSKATATRDLQHLVEINALAPIGSGRSTSYKLKI